MKDILIVAHFTQVPGEIGNNRFRYIADMLSDSGHKVEIVTSQFAHRRKRMRYVEEEQLNKLNYKLTMLYESGYKKNVSLRRFYSHYVFGKSLEKYLLSRETPDLIYCAVPSLDAGYVAAKYAKNKNVRFIIDVQDLWPEAFKLVFNFPFISRFVFYPMNKKANYIYNSANDIVAVSDTYLRRAKEVNNATNKDISVYLGTDLTYIDKIIEENEIKKPRDEIWLSYCGTLGHSYDIPSVIEALNILKRKGINNIKFVVMGDGPLKSKYEDYAKRNQIWAEFMGRVDYNRMIAILNSSDIAVNPIMPNSAGSIINKVGDYAATGLPVLNTQESLEYRELIEAYKAGINCINNDAEDLADKILLLYNDETKRIEMGMNNRRLAEEKFDRFVTYKKIRELVSD